MECDIIYQINIYKRGICVMYLKKSKSKKSGRTHLSIAQNYWDNINKKSKTKTIESPGYLDDLLKKFTEPISHFESVVARMTEDQ